MIKKAQNTELLRFFKKLSDYKFESNLNITLIKLLKEKLADKKLFTKAY